jgi:hypothetical protein
MKKPIINPYLKRKTPPTPTTTTNPTTPTTKKKDPDPFPPPIVTKKRKTNHNDVVVKPTTNHLPVYTYNNNTCKNNKNDDTITSNNNNNSNSNNHMMMMMTNYTKMILNHNLGKLRTRKNIHFSWIVPSIYENRLIGRVYYSGFTFHHIHPKPTTTTTFHIGDIVHLQTNYLNEIVRIVSVYQATKSYEGTPYSNSNDNDTTTILEIQKRGTSVFFFHKEKKEKLTIHRSSYICT